MLSCTSEHRMPLTSSQIILNLLSKFSKRQQCSLFRLKGCSRENTDSDGCELLELQNYSLNVPSWVPDWTFQGLNAPGVHDFGKQFGRSKPVFNAAGESVREVTPGPGPLATTIVGGILDRIAVVRPADNNP